MPVLHANFAARAAAEHATGLISSAWEKLRMTARMPVSAATADAVLDETLRAIRLADPAFLHAHLSAPFGIIIRPDEDVATPPAQVGSLSVFHLILSGNCRIGIESGEKHQVSAGDIVVLPFGATHTIWSGDSTDMEPVRDLMQPGPADGLWRLDHGGSGATTQIFSGFIDSSAFVRMPVWTSLPPLLVDRNRDHVSAMMTSAVHGLLSPNAAGSATTFALERLTEFLLVQMVRRHAERLTQAEMNWLAALNDPVVGRALQAIHCDTTRRWTVNELAREAATSRSVLSERFAAMVGQSPIEYLTGFRIQIAAERLRNTNDGLAEVAVDSGYESQAAFHRAFKRIAGIAPGQWRQAGALDKLRQS